jgi:hypothetical protein
MQREREDYFVKTLADARQVPRVTPSLRGDLVGFLMRVRVDSLRGQKWGAPR